MAHLKSSSVLLPLAPDGLPTSVATALIDDDGAASYTSLAWELPGLADKLPFMLQATTLLHTGSIATMLAPGATEVLAAVEQAHPSATISYDPNCRPSIITDADYARRPGQRASSSPWRTWSRRPRMRTSRWLSPAEESLDSARRWLTLGGSEGPRRGGGHPRRRGALGRECRRGEAHFPAPSVKVADTVGADGLLHGRAAGVVDLGLAGAQNHKDLRPLCRKPP